jgi:hypothetical protein
VPAAQLLQTVAPFAAEYLPAAQLTHVEDDVAPVWAEYLPAVQAAHASLAEVPPALVPYVPAGQSESHGSLCPEVESYEPMAQRRQDVDDAAPLSGEYLPAAQGEQVAADVAACSAEKVPAAQGVQVAADTAPLAAE